MSPFNREGAESAKGDVSNHKRHKIHKGLRGSGPWFHVRS